MWFLSFFKNENFLEATLIEVKGEIQFGCLMFVCSVVFIVYICSTFLKMYLLCNNIISCNASHQLKLEEPYVAYKPRIE